MMFAMLIALTPRLAHASTYARTSEICAVDGLESHINAAKDKIKNGTAKVCDEVQARQKPAATCGIVIRYEPSGDPRLPDQTFGFKDGSVHTFVGNVHTQIFSNHAYIIRYKSDSTSNMKLLETIVPVAFCK